jgi:hypothetical protein
VLSPSLVDRGDGKPIPHRYNDGSLCLFDDEKGEWHPADSMAATILPWTSEWLYFYEIWLATGIWQGDVDNSQKLSSKEVLEHVRTNVEECR